MRSRVVPIVLVALLLVLQSQLWMGRGSMRDVAQLETKLRAQKESNARAALANDRLSAEVVAFVQSIRERELFKAPGVAETLDWAQALVHLHRDHLDRETVEQTLGCILKDRHDLRELNGEELTAALVAAGEEER